MAAAADGVKQKERWRLICLDFVINFLLMNVVDLEKNIKCVGISHDMILSSYVRWSSVCQIVL